MLKIQRILNHPVKSNCYVISHSKNEACLVIDPGTESNYKLLKYLESNQFNIKAVILTHEHYDHIAGVNNLFKEMSFQLLCTEAASWGIGNSKINFSAYMDRYESIEIQNIAELIREGESMVFGNSTIQFYETPGHSSGSLCFSIDNNIFTGDTILDSIRVPLKIPGGNKVLHSISIKKLKKIIYAGMIIYPGHGNFYEFKSQAFWTLS